jgi:hypothetical protein
LSAIRAMILTIFHRCTPNDPCIFAGISGSSFHI